MELHIYRALVRGRFGTLDPDLRADLLARAGEHSVFDAAFTRAGTLTYDDRLVAFTFRYEIRESGDDPEAAAKSQALAMATASLADGGITHGELDVTLTDMADVWER